MRKLNCNSLHTFISIRPCVAQCVVCYNLLASIFRVSKGENRTVFPPPLYKQEGWGEVEETGLKPHLNDSRNYTVRIHMFFQPVWDLLFFILFYYFIIISRRESRNNIFPSLNLKQELFTSFLRLGIPL